MMERPTRAPEVEINEVTDGFVVYDPVRDRVHYLNHIAALVLEFCTGGNTEDEIVHLLVACYDLPDPPTEEIGTCLEQLRNEGLIT